MNYEEALLIYCKRPFQGSLTQSVRRLLAIFVTSHVINYFQVALPSRVQVLVLVQVIYVDFISKPMHRSFLGDKYCTQLVLNLYKYILLVLKLFAWETPSAERLTTPDVLEADVTSVISLYDVATSYLLGVLVLVLYAKYTMSSEIPHCNVTVTQETLARWTTWRASISPIPKHHPVLKITTHDSRRNPLFLFGIPPILVHENMMFIHCAVVVRQVFELVFRNSSNYVLIMSWLCQVRAGSLTIKQKKLWLVANFQCKEADISMAKTKNVRVDHPKNLHTLVKKHS